MVVSLVVRPVAAGFDWRVNRGMNRGFTWQFIRGFDWRLNRGIPGSAPAATGCDEAGAVAGWELAGDASPVLCRDACGTTSAVAVVTEFAAVVAMVCPAAIAVPLWFAVCVARRAASAVVLRVVVQPLCCAASHVIRHEVAWPVLRGAGSVVGSVPTGVVRSGLT
jgi:hypothetical protein